MAVAASCQYIGNKRYTVQYIQYSTGISIAYVRVISQTFYRSNRTLYSFVTGRFV